ncbi:hypothetical protein FDUTEX481_09944 [Tolypothrix sp. PCC 7601]|nr:hypothetical protein FDUTEX481_09944 [Tolypothrix sp. PCC 7601]
MKILDLWRVGTLNYKGMNVKYQQIQKLIVRPAAIMITYQFLLDSFSCS